MVLCTDCLLIFFQKHVCFLVNYSIIFLSMIIRRGLVVTMKVLDQYFSYVITFNHFLIVMSSY